MLPIRLSEEQVEELFQRARVTDGYRLTIDLEAQTISDEQGAKYRFEVEPHRRDCLLKGLDDIGLTLQHEGRISEYEERRTRFQ